MPRNMSFMLTTAQVRARTKFVTRRMGWENVRVGEVLNACVKCMGLKKGERIEVICQIRVVKATRQKLLMMTWEKGATAAEGFPGMKVKAFIRFFCASHPGCQPFTTITRIQFEYL